MKSLELNKIYSTQIAKLTQDNGFSADCSTEIMDCTSLGQVFQVLTTKGTSHIAVLSKSSEPIADMLGYIKEQLAVNGTVALALFYDYEQPMVAHS